MRSCKGHGFLVGFFAGLAVASLARRSAVRLRAAANDAFLARAVRSDGVMLRAATFPPCLPNWRATSVIAARTSAGIFTLMPSMVHLTLYGLQKQRSGCELCLTP